MRRDQLEHAIRTACQIIKHEEVIVVGSQAILGSFHEAELPLDATMSQEVDVLPAGNGEDDTERLVDEIEGVAGEFSMFNVQHGFYIDGVGPRTAILPEGWRGRLVKVQNANTAASGGEPRFIGWCLDKEDLCVAKLCAHREKDIRFVSALLDRRLVDADIIVQRLALVPAEHDRSADLARAWLTGRGKPRRSN